MEPLRPAEPGDFGDPERPDGDPERLEAGPSRPTASRARTIVLATAVIATGILVAGTALSGVTGSGGPQPVSVQSPTPTASRTPINWPAPRRPTPTPQPPEFGSSGFLADLDVVVYARSRRAVYRIDTAAEKVTRTPMEQLGSTGPVAFLPLPDRVLVRPLDEVAGFQVVDGEPATQLGGLLAHGGMYLPGPKDRIWVIDTPENGRSRARLTDRSGRRVYATIRSPGFGSFSADGAGGLFYTDIGGVYRASASGLRRVTSGSILATGPKQFLTLECDETFACGIFGYQHGAGASEPPRRVGPAELTQGASGELSPDGRYAAVVVWIDDDGPVLVVHDVRAGRRINAWLITDDDGFGAPPLAWLPDGRLLSLRNGRLSVFDPRTNESASTTLRLPPLLQVALRPPAG